MKAYQNDTKAKKKGGIGAPSEQLRIAITFKRKSDGLGPTTFAAPMSAASALSFRPDPVDVDLALHELDRRGFITTGRGALTASVRGTRAQFEKVFGTSLSVFKLDPTKPYEFHSFYFPADGAPWNPDPALMQLIDDAYIQWPHIYMAAKHKVAAGSKAGSGGGAVTPAAKPPHVNKWHLDVPIDVARLLNATPVHLAGGSGKGVRICMVDTGFAHSHPFFAAHGYKSSVILAQGATNRDTDPGSHGTGESANVFSIAPGATFIGVKLTDDADMSGGASILEGFQEALKHNPHVITISMGYDLRAAGTNDPLATLPQSLKALEAEIHAAVANGVVVVFSAGNGHYSFPGQMPDVLSAGGVFVDQVNAMRASDYASAFKSLIYSGRSVPDCSGLVGLLPFGDYLMLPVPSGQQLDKEEAAHDGTTPTDGWALFSGTSAAAPQLAGVCALLLEKNPALKPSDVKAILMRTARIVKTGHANPASDSAGAGETAANGAAGTGLVDAHAAWLQA